MKTIVISGGTGYLGSAIIKALADYQVIPFKEDITDSRAVREFAKKLPGRIFGVIHAASAPLVRKPLLSLTEEEFTSQFSVNVIGAFHVIKYLAPLISPGGCMIGITTKALDEAVHAPSGSYLPAKYGLRGLLHILAEELKGMPIRVYEVAPAFMPGGLNNDMPKAVVDFIQKKSDHTTPERVAQEILQLIQQIS